MTNQAEKICFVIAPIGEAESETRKRSDQVLRHIIAPAAKSHGYKAVRADELDKPGMITSQVIQHVIEDPLVVADLTGRNPNVFYELAIRHAIRKPVIQIISKGENIPFDVAGTRTIFVDIHDLDNVASARSSIVEQIESLESDSSNLETPISVSLDLQRLRQSENPEQRSLADIVSALSNIGNSISVLEQILAKSGNESLSRLDALSERIDVLVMAGRRRSFQEALLERPQSQSRRYTIRRPEARSLEDHTGGDTRPSEDDSLPDLPW